MLRYMVFSFEQHYPSGGMNDFSFSFDTKEQFKTMFYNKNDYYHIFDTVEKKMVTNEYMNAFELEEWVEGYIF